MVPLARRGGRDAIYRGDTAGALHSAPDGARVSRLDTLALPVSSSDIRRRLALGEMPDDLPAAVGRYIVERGLYDWPTAPPRG